MAVVFNPSSGAPGRGGISGRRCALQAALAAHAIPTLWFETSRADPGEAATRAALAGGADLLMVSGGDGTVMACAKALVGTTVPLAVVPSGTGNIIATSLRLPVTVDEAVEIALNGGRRRIDLGVVAPDRALFAASIGFSAAVMRDATPALKTRVGMFAYLVSAGRHMKDPPTTFSLWFDDEPPIIRESHAILVGNFGEIMTKPRLARTALDDGVLEVGILRVKPLLDWVRQDRPALRPRRRPPLDWYQARKVTIVCDRPQPCERDGDCFGISSRLEIHTLPRSLEVCAPHLTGLPQPRRSLSDLVARDVHRLLPWA
ncbi:diacylglycerol/lipid kinase family protein [Rhodococcus koreensis]